MKRILASLAITAFLAGCGGDGSNPFDSDETDGDGTATEGHVIPETLSQDLSSFNYDADNKTLTVTGITQDSSPLTTLFTRNQALDVAGYEAYTVQDDALFRHVIALVRQSGNSGSVRAGVVSTGGQFNRIHNGGYYERDGNYVHRTTGKVRYVGTYAGLTNLQVSNDLLPVAPGTPVEILPGQSAQTQGNIVINADFNDSSIEGAIYDRELVASGINLPSIVLVTGAIADDGTFFGGQVEYDGEIDLDIGDYGGIFGGPDAEAVGGVVNLTEFENADHPMTDNTGAPILDGAGNPVIYDGEIETGVFVLDSCESADQSSPLCNP